MSSEAGFEEEDGYAIASDRCMPRDVYGVGYGVRASATESFVDEQGQ